MSVSMNTTNPIFSQTETAQGLKIIGAAKNQMELEGKMALQLIQSASAPQTQSSTANSGSVVGSVVNISV